ncbi:MAG: 1-deoxy-D-xylulose-5-phosphate reductoisomerase [Desulfatibacillaceae bacterium]
MKRLSILGSTGSIGKNVLRVVEMFPERFTVGALCAATSVDLLSEQVRIHVPDLAVVADEAHAARLRGLLPRNCPTRVLHGAPGYEEAAALADCDMVVSAMVGAAGLLPTMAALRAKKPVALANKETLVMAGELVMARAAASDVRLLPVDSEHSAIFQCLEGQDRAGVSRILLTASGGPFRTLQWDRFGEITPEQALRHPNWDMGRKITIDSATLMNKGLEVIEARWLFDVPADHIRVIVHPESIVHSMVSYVDGSVIAQMGIPDMLGPIAYALSYPERLPMGQPVPDFADLGTLAFEEPDLERFPCLALAFQACEAQKTYPAVLNAANEIAVAAFLDHRLAFTGIPEVIRAALDEHEPVSRPDLDDVLAADRWARQYVEGKTGS